MTDRPWTFDQPLSLLNSGSSLPGPPVSSDELVALIEKRFGFGRSREALAIAHRFAIETRHICRPFAARQEAALPGQANADLAARAVQAALDAAGIEANELGYLIGHTTTPDQQLPPNVANVADRIGYRGPFVELRQACTGFANALMIACGLLARADAAPVAIVGSETGSLFFDPARLDEEAGQVVNMMQMGDGAGAVILGGQKSSGDALLAGWFGAMGLSREPGFQLRTAASIALADGAVAAADCACIPGRAVRLCDPARGGGSDHRSLRPWPRGSRSAGRAPRPRTWPSRGRAADCAAQCQRSRARWPGTGRHRYAGHPLTRQSRRTDPAPAGDH